MQAFHTLPGTAAAVLQGLAAHLPSFAAALRRPVLESGLQSSGLALHLCTVLRQTCHGPADEASLRCRSVGAFPWETEEVVSSVREDPGCLDVGAN